MLVVLARMLRMREGCQQAADLGGGHGDEVAYVVAAMVIMPQACPGKLSTAAGAPFELRRPEGRQARAWTVCRAGTRRRSGGPVVVQAGLVLGGLEAFLARTHASTALPAPPWQTTLSLCRPSPAAVSNRPTLGRRRPGPRRSEPARQPEQLDLRGTARPTPSNCERT